MIRLRSAPGLPRAFSELTISVDPPAVASPAGDARTIQLLRRARGLGVITFDVAEARFPARAERLISAAFPERDPELSVIVGRSVGSLAREEAPEGRVPGPGRFSGVFLQSLERSNRRLAPAVVSWVQWDSEGEDERNDAAGGPSVPPDTELPAGVGWAIRLPPGGPGPRVDWAKTALFSGPLSPLEQGLTTAFGDRSLPTGPRLLARDPFAAGRLDGSRFARVGPFSVPGSAPTDVRRLHEEFDPVLQLGFLTEGRRRTLAQASLQFVLSFPWVISAVVPLPEPERFEEVLAVGSRPPLSADDLERLASLK